MIVVLAGITCFMCFGGLGGDALHQWDESRNGVNAIEMLQRSDYINLFYASEPDTWNNKPPLFIWLVAGSFKLFGMNEFALRFPSALAIFLFFMIFYKIVSLYKSPLFAFFTSILLMTVNGIVGYHFGRTGDFDALLMLFIIAAIYFILRYIDFNQKNSIIYAAIALSFAFLTKGFAFLIIFPGIFLYFVFYRKVRFLLADYKFYIAGIILITTIISWYLILDTFGIKYERSFYGSANAFETMWKHDIFQRIISGTSASNESNYAFFIHFLDARFNLWNYIFYLVLIVWIYERIMRKGESKSYEELPNRILWFSAFMWISIAVFLTFSAEKHFWYMSPALPFIAITTIEGIKHFATKHRYFQYIAGLLLLFTFTREAVDHFVSQKQPEVIIVNKEKISKANRVICVKIDRQDLLCYIMMNNPNIINVKNTSEINLITGDIIFIKEADQFTVRDIPQISY